MALPEIAQEREAYMADTETENIQLREDNKRLRERRNYWCVAYQEERDRLLELKAQRHGDIKTLMADVEFWHDACQHKGDATNQSELESLWRDHLNECDPQDDDDYEAQARQILCDKGDIEKQIAAEGYDKTDSEYVPF